MFKNTLAVTFHRPMTNGRTKPCLLTTFSQELREENEVVAKFAESCDEKTYTLVIEAIANFLACDLNLPIPESQLVELNSEFVEAIHTNSSIQNIIRNSVPYAFAVKKLPPAFTVLPNPVSDLTEEQLQSALEIFIFDMLIKNPDRRVSNPNCLGNGKTFAIFDHDLSLREKVFSFDADPWEVGYMDNQNFSEHVFYKALKGKSAHLNLDDFVGHFRKITDQRLKEYKDALPLEWLQNNTLKVDNLLNFLATLRDNVKQALNVIRSKLV